jgi:hypothetical protein
MRSGIARSVVAWSLLLAGPVSVGLAVPTITIGTIQLQPNTAGQVVELSVTGGDAVPGLSLYLQVANGGPEFETLAGLTPGSGIDGPAMTAIDLVTGTIFDGNNTGQTDGSDPAIPQVAFVYITTASGTVAASGLLARVTFDTTGLTGGTYPLSLTVLGSPTDFAGVEAALVDGTLVVGDGGSGSQTGQAPVADAGPDQVADSGATVSLSGTATDPDSTSLTYHWSQTGGPAVVLSSPNALVASFVAPSGIVNSQLTFEFSVSDGETTTSDSMSVTVNADEQVFTVNAGPDQTVLAGALVQLSGSVENAPAGTLLMEWIQAGGPAVTLTGSTTSSPTFLAPAGLTNTVLTFEFWVSDGTHDVVDTVDVTVDANASRPTAGAGDDQSVSAGQTVQLAGTAADPAGLGVSYLWVQADGPEVILSDETVLNPTFTAPSQSSAADVVLELRVTAGAYVSVDTVTIHVAAAVTSVDPGSGEADNTTSGETTDGSQESNAEASNSIADFLASLFNSPLAGAIGFGLIFLALLLLWWLWL